jgi:hypothetical protein
MTDARRSLRAPGSRMNARSLPLVGHQAPIVVSGAERWMTNFDTLVSFPRFAGAPVAPFLFHPDRNARLEQGDARALARPGPKGLASAVGVLRYAAIRTFSACPRHPGDGWHRRLLTSTIHPGRRYTCAADRPVGSPDGTGAGLSDRRDGPARLNDKAARSRCKGRAWTNTSAS